MIVLLIILVVAAVGGVAAYVVMQYAGVDSKVPTTSGTSGGFHSGFIERRGGSVAERIANTPSGCLVAVLIAAAVWIALWLVVLVLGLRVLTV